MWRVLGKRVRARGKLESAISGLPFAIERAMARAGEADLLSLAQRKQDAASIGFGVHLHLTRDNRRWAQGAFLAIARQSVAPVRIFVTGDGTASTDKVRGDRIIFLAEPYSSRTEGLAAALAEAKFMGLSWLVTNPSGSTLTPNAIAAYSAHAVSMRESRSVNVIYGDVRESPGGLLSAVRRTYWFKPHWDPRMFLSQDYVTAGCALAVGPSLHALTTADYPAPASLSELILRLGANGAVEHCMRVVAQSVSETWSRADDERLTTIQSTLGERGFATRGPYGTSVVRWSLPTVLPTVTVIVATRDRLELLRPCVEGVLNATDYCALDLIIADNESVEPETLSYMEAVAGDPRVQVVRWPHPFNYSAINNFAALHAKGEYLCLLNNDIEVIEPEWLTEMVREVVQPGVGAVGARLLYPDRTIQHAGVAIGIGNAAGHAHRGLPEGDPGYFAQALIARGASAVTAACLLVSKAHFDDVGGLDEERLAVAYNDVDLCLKLREKGLVNIYTPLATLIHHESKSRGLDFAPEHLERYMRELKVFQERWGTKSVVDPWHHAMLARGGEVYSRHESD